MKPHSRGPDGCRDQHCEVCDAPFLRKDRKQRTCSRACGVMLRTGHPMGAGRPRASKVYFKTCDQCGALFTTNRSDAKRCSEPCRKAATRAAFAVTWTSAARPTTRPCADCGEDYTTLTATNGGVCKRCQRRRRGKSDRKRARYYGVEYEPVNRLKVYERDRWKCGLCGGRIARKQKAPHPKAASLDHVIPISEGGPHTYANVQCAHFICNSLKSTGGQQQLALVG